MVIYRDGICKKITNQINKSNLFCYGLDPAKTLIQTRINSMKVEDRGTPFIEKNQ